MNSDQRGLTGDPFLLGYNATDLRIASEFLSNWLPFLSRDLCRHCAQTLSDRVRSIEPEVDGDVEPIKKEENLSVLTPNSMDSNEFSENQNNWDTNSLGSWKDAAEMNDTSNMNSLGSWKDGANGLSEHVTEASTSDSVGSPVVPIESPKVRMSWADMAQEDELEAEEENEVIGESVDGHTQSEPREATVAVKVGQKSESWADMAQEDELEGEEEHEVTGESVDGHAQSEPREATAAVKVGQKSELSRDQREYIRFSSVKRKKDFICLERVKGKIVNIMDGLELHTGVFSAAEQKRIVDFVYLLQEKGKKGELKERTYSAPQKWMRGKGRVTIQFGCCYNYAMDKNGNPPGILQNEIADPIPPLFNVIIKRLVRWHVIPPSCVPDSCIVNIYEEGDCIPPHIDNHDFVRPFCTVSFLSECNVLFGSNLKIVGPGDFSGAMAIPLPVGSVLVLNGNGADVAKHCVPAVPTKRISITFRKMHESKVPIGFVTEPDLQGLQPLSYETGRSKRPAQPVPKPSVNRQGVRREDNRDRGRGSAGRGNNHLDPQVSLKIQLGPSNKRRVKVNLDG